MASNPIDTSRLRLDEEVRSIQEKIRLSEYRDSVSFESRWAVRSSDILQAINETNPTIIHFSGHGAHTGEIVLQNPDGSARLVAKDAIAAAISTASDSVRLVTFNACFSEEQAKSVVGYIDAAIGMNDSINNSIGAHHGFVLLSVSVYEWGDYSGAAERPVRCSLSTLSGGR